MECVAATSTRTWAGSLCCLRKSLVILTARAMANDQADTADVNTPVQLDVSNSSSVARAVCDGEWSQALGKQFNNVCH